MTQVPQERVLVYDRVDANRGSTRRLLALFALVLLPVGAYLATYLMLWVALILGIAIASFGIADVFSADEDFIIAFGVVDAAISILILLAAAYLQFRFAAAVVLRLAGARPVGRHDEPEFSQAVENLCIGAGLPQPRLYVVETPAANAFSAGMEPKSASLAVTRGLMNLLDRQELEGVLAHELGQIGNYDTRLATVLAAGVGLLRLPLTMVVGFFRFLFRIHWALGWGLLLYLGLPVLATIPFGIYVAADFLKEDPLVGLLFISSMALPFYIFLGAPLLASIIRKAVLREREYLADAEAVLLTRYPDGLARALAKMGAAGNRGMKVGAAAAHLYVVDPLPQDAPWWDEILRCHPPMEKRIALLAGMGGGIPPSVLESARAAGKQFQTVAPAVPADLASGAGEESGFSPETPSGAAYRLAAPRTPVYEKPDTGTARLVELPGGSLIAVWAVVGDFFRVILRDDRFGYISRGTAMTPVEPAGVPEE